MNVQPLSEGDENVQSAPVTDDSLQNEISQDDQKLYIQQKIQKYVDEKSKFYKFLIDYLEETDSDKDDFDGLIKLLMNNKVKIIKKNSNFFSIYYHIFLKIITVMKYSTKRFLKLLNIMKIKSNKPFQMTKYMIYSKITN